MAEDRGACDAAWFAEAAGGTLENGRNAAIAAVETDSRNARPGSLFVAIAGERCDGHDFARRAADAGASALLVSSTWLAGPGKKALEGSGAAVIAVGDPVRGLQLAATAYRRRFPSLRRLGVTGSTGKTSVKELLAAIVSRSRKTVKNPGNLNSDIGLPASIFGIRQEHEAAVFEMGINYPGEMDILASVYEPDYALVTNVGTAHVGVLGGTRAHIAAEKGRIASRFDGSQTLVVWEDDDYRDALLSGLRGRGETYGPRSTDGFEGARDLGLDGWVLRYAGLEARLRLPGAHNLLNALAAIRLASLSGSSPEDVAGGLETVAPMEGRTRVLRGEYTVVDDCYNANAESAEAAIRFCAEAPVPGRRILVLGSMKELGAESEASHRRLGLAAAASGAALVFFYGEEARAAYEAARGVASGAAPGAELRHYDDYGTLESDVARAVRPGDLVLVKASRSMALERLVERLTGIGGSHVP